MPKKVIIPITLVMVIIIALFIWTFAIPRNSISIGGSASVDPILQRLTPKYKEYTKPESDEDEKKPIEFKPIEFIYSSTGSGRGITNVQSEDYEIGFISKEVQSKEFDRDIQEDTNIINYTFEEEWISDFSKHSGEYRYVNFANDPIVFVYNIKGLDMSENLIKTLFDFDIKDNKLAPAYSRVLNNIYKANSSNEVLSWYEFCQQLLEIKKDEYNNNSNKNNALSLNELNEIKEEIETNKKLKNAPVLTYTTQPGSGTRSSLKDLTKYDGFDGVVPGRQSNKYPNNGSIFYQISKSVGSFGFLSMSYALKINEDKFPQLRTVAIEGNAIHEDASNWREYKLTRPFNAIYKIHEDKTRMERNWSFLKWIMIDPDIESSFSEAGLIRNNIKI